MTTVWEKRRFQGDLIEAFHYLKGSYRKERDRLLSRVFCVRTRGNGFKPKEGRFRLDIRKKSFIVRVVRHWNRLPWDAVDALSLEAFKARLDHALGNPCSCARPCSLQNSWTRWLLKVPFNSNKSMILWLELLSRWHRAKTVHPPISQVNRSSMTWTPLYKIQYSIPTLKQRETWAEGRRFSFLLFVIFSCSYPQCLHNALCYS